MQNVQNLKEFAKQVAQVIDVFAANKIVHSDLRLDNILVRVINYGDGQAISDLKVIDFSSAFSLGSVEGVSNVIPEYMPQELLQHIARPDKSKAAQPFYNAEHPWAIDVWSLGCVLLEIITAVPIWMPFKTQINLGLGRLVSAGVFAVKDRALDKILERQLRFVKNIDAYLSKYSLLTLDASLLQVLKGIFKINPTERLSPKQIIALLN